MGLLHGSEGEWQELVSRAVDEEAEEIGQIKASKTPKANP